MAIRNKLGFAIDQKIHVEKQLNGTTSVALDDIKLTNTSGNVALVIESNGAFTPAGTIKLTFHDGSTDYPLYYVVKDGTVYAAGDIMFFIPLPTPLFPSARVIKEKIVSSSASDDNTKIINVYTVIMP